MRGRNLLRTLLSVVVVCKVNKLDERGHTLALAAARVSWIWTWNWAFANGAVHTARKTQSVSKLRLGAKCAEGTRGAVISDKRVSIR